MADQFFFPGDYELRPADMMLPLVDMPDIAEYLSGEAQVLSLEDSGQIPDIQNPIWQSFSEYSQMDPQVYQSHYNEGPHVINITVQPQKFGYRFRYRKEGEKHGVIKGESAETKKQKSASFPEIQIDNVPDDVSSVEVEIRLVSAGDGERPHPSTCCQKGIYTKNVSKRDHPNFKIPFDDLQIVRVKKNDQLSTIYEQLKVLNEKNNIRFHEPLKTEDELKKEAKALADSKSDLIVRLRFQVSYTRNNQWVKAFAISQCIDGTKDKYVALRICHLSATSCRATGGADVVLLCEKLPKDEIRVKFCDENGWIKDAIFTPADIHHQVAIKFKVPEYKDIHIQQSVDVKLYLYQPSTNSQSDSVDFKYTPEEELEEITKKRKRAYNRQSHFDPQGSAGPSTGMFNQDLNLPFVPFIGDGYEDVEADSIKKTQSVKSDFPTDISDESTDLETDCALDISELAKAGANSQRVKTKETHTAHEGRCKNVEAELNLDNREVQSILVCLKTYAITGDFRCFLSQYRNLFARKNMDGDNSLHLAVIHNQLSALKSILSVCSSTYTIESINQYNNTKQTALHMATVTKNAQMVEALLLNKADPFIVDKNGNNCFHIAARTGDHSSMKKLCAWFKNANKDIKSLNGLNYDGCTPLHVSVMSNSSDCVGELIEAGVSVDLGNSSSGKSPLHYAVENDNILICMKLITEGSADVNTQAFDGNTPLHLAVSAKKTNLIKLLLAAGANPDIENFDISEGNGKTPKELTDDNQIIKELDSVSSHSELRSLPDDQSIGQLSPEAQYRLSQMLDYETSDWKRLAKAFQLNSLVSVLENEPETKPSVLLLGYLENEGISMDELITKLNVIGRRDCVEVCNDFISRKLE